MEIGNTGSALGGAEVKRETEFDREAKALALDLLSLDRLFGVLQDRLGSVLVPKDRKDSVEKNESQTAPTAPPANTGMGQYLRIQRTVVEAMLKTLVSVVDRLEI